MKFEVTILGSSSALPIFNRNPSAQLLKINDQCFLIDCGEGIQTQLFRYGLKAQRIQSIFISHMHGDHYLGLMGLLSSLHLNGRTKPMHVFGPAALEEITKLQLKHSQTELLYPLYFHNIDANKAEKIFENEEVIVETIILEHRIPCTGFKFIKRRSSPKLNKAKIEEFQIPLQHLSSIKQGLDYVSSTGSVYPAATFLLAAEDPPAYAYCSDTRCSGNYLGQLQGVSTLYHEATFKHDMLARAQETFHSTALQAAEVAKQVGVKKLLIGHFSARYRELDSLLEEARGVFKNTSLALEGQTFSI